MRRLLPLFFLLFLLFAALPVAAAESCIPQQLQAALNRCDVVLLRGVHQGDFTITRDGLRLIGDETAAIEGALTIAADRVAVIGVAFSDAEEQTDGPLLRVGDKRLGTAHNVVVANSDFSNSGHHGVTIFGGSSALIVNNSFHDFFFGRAADANGFTHHIYAQSGDTIIARNTFEGRACGHNCFAIHAFSRQGDVAGVRIIGNWISGGDVVVGGNRNVSTAGTVFAANTLVDSRVIFGWRAVAETLVVGNSFEGGKIEVNAGELFVFANNEASGAIVELYDHAASAVWNDNDFDGARFRTIRDGEVPFSAWRDLTGYDLASRNK